MAGMDGSVSDALLKMGRHLRPGTVSADLRSLYQVGGRQSDAFYRDRWSHDKVVRSTHGGELHGFVLVEGLRQGRDHHLGGAADRLSERRR
ncbi:hypothetical protein GCM10020220_085300 [Nonomuraea rubra]